MAYLRCESCGAKALVAASRCPRCATDFDLIGAGGARLPLVQCRGCGIMHARGRACHWCPEKSARTWRSPMVGVAASAMLLAGAAASTWSYRAEIESAYSRAMERTPKPLVKPAARPAAPLAPAPTSVASTPSAPSAPSAASAASAPQAALPTAVVVAATAPPAASALPGDTVHWVPAIARTWVNVRNQAGRENQVVGVIRTGSRALLGGTGRAGWRQVRTDSAVGWVNPKHFDVDSVRTRG